MTTATVAAPAEREPEQLGQTVVVIGQTVVVIGRQRRHWARSSPASARRETVAMKLEVAVVPVSDVDRARVAD